MDDSKNILDILQKIIGAMTKEQFLALAGVLYDVFAPKK